MRIVPRSRRLSRSLLAAAVGLGTLLAAAPSALAHAAFVESQPPPGQRLQQTPARVVLEFTEPLSRKLTKANLVNVATGERVPATVEASPGRQLILRPSGPLETGPYRVDWHTVSTQDGHALEGSFGFGVRAAAASGEQRLEQSPLARDGWLRVLLRGLLYAALFFFVGGLLGAVLLSPRGGPGDWLVPGELQEALTRAGREPARFAHRLWRRTVDAGWLAAGAAVGVALIEAEDASGSFGVAGLSDYLLGNVAGIARVVTVAAIALALLHAGHLRLVAAAWGAIAFLAIAFGGHANSAEPRVAAVATDWVHLIAASVWIGGIAQVASAWAFGLRGVAPDLRRAVMRSVLERFGRVALPAFLLVASTGLTNALIQLGHFAALWETAYGRVLAVKIALVGTIALASYVHALRLRPRLLAANPHPSGPLERRHWRLLRAEPVLAVAVVAAAALLAVFPLPPRQLREGAEAKAASGGAAACDPCPQRKPREGELAVAEQAGSALAAFWLRQDGGGIRGELRLLGRDLRPRQADVRIDGAATVGCGPGCWRFRISGRPATVTARVPERGRTYLARVPARWDPGAGRRARRLLELAQRTMARLRSLRQDEAITSGPGIRVTTRYRLEAPDRFSYTTSGGTESIVIGRREWLRAEGPLFERRRFGGGGPGFRTRSWFRWTSYARFVQLPDGRGGPRQLLQIALMDEATPVWYRLQIDPASMRVVRVRMIAEGHFMTQRLYAFNSPPEIEPPSQDDVAR